MIQYEFPAKERLVRTTELPDPFVGPDGIRITKTEQWPEQQVYIKEMLSHYLYGHSPEEKPETTGEVLFTRPVYSGRAVCETVRITTGPGGQIAFDCDIIRPNTAGRVPVITWNQFQGYHGSPIEEEAVCERGYAIAEFDKEQLAVDSPEMMQCKLALAYPEYDWGTIAMWAWGHSRVVDYLETTDWADLEKLVATGHSRGGKAALCAGIYDDRFAVTAPNGSGCGGCGSFRYLGGRLGEGTGLCETAGSICDCFAFWFTDEFAKYGYRAFDYTRSTMTGVKIDASTFQNPDFLKIVGKQKDEALLPFDMHFARAAIAPRAIISTDALGDVWANTYGTQILWRAAQEVFDFLHVPGHNAMHFRDGKHEYQALDWRAMLDFCDEIFYEKKHENNTVIIRDGDQPNPMDFRFTKQHYSWGQGS